MAVALVHDDFAIHGSNEDIFRIGHQQAVVAPATNMVIALVESAVQMHEFSGISFERGRSRIQVWIEFRLAGGGFGLQDRIDSEG